MINAVNYNTYSYPLYNTYNSNKIVDFDYTAAVSEANKKAQELLDSLQTKKIVPAVSTPKALQKESFEFLNVYTLSMKNLDQAAEKLRNSNLDRLLYSKSGEIAEITEETAQNTVGAVKDMFEKYNSTLKLLNDNADRGPGVMKQIARMVTADPASVENMAKLGMSVNKDGTLNLNEKKLSDALKTKDPIQLKSLKSLLGGLNGIADKIHVNALYGSNMSSRSLIGNDVLKTKDLQKENPFYVLYQQIKGNVYALNDMAYAGLYMNTRV